MSAKRYCKGHYFDVTTETEIEFENGLYLSGDKDVAVVQLSDGLIIVTKVGNIKFTEPKFRIWIGTIKRCSGN